MASWGGAAASKIRKLEAVGKAKVAGLPLPLGHCGSLEHIVK